MTQKGLAASKIGKGDRQTHLGSFDFFWKKLNFQAAIKSAASAASLDLQGSPRTTALGMQTAGLGGLPCKSWEAALAADLIAA